MIAVIGATGNTGKIITEILLSGGRKVKAVGRSEEKLAGFASQGAVISAGQLDNAGFLTSAFENAEAVYALIPPHFTADNFRAYQNKTGNAIKEAIVNSGVKKVVTLSSIGAHMTEGAGVVQGLYDFEQMLNTIEGVDIKHLRAGFFFQNFFGMIPVIKMMGVLGGFPMDPEIKMPMVHTKDIGNVAAKYLMNPDFNGKSYTYVSGQRDLTFRECASVLGSAIGNSGLKYVQFSYEDARNGMMQMGTSASLAHAYVEFCKGMNSGRVLEDYKRTAENTTPTSIEDFAVEFSHVYNM
jgi:uncharacterized protein YbjT (DUF2867 family)